MPGAYIWGWDYDAEDWVKCRVDDAGKLIIGSGTIEVEQDTPADLQATVTPAAGAEFLNYSRIPSGGTQIAKYKTVANTSAEIHEVTAEKTLYLSCMIFSVRNHSGGEGYSTIWVTNAADTAQYIFHRAQTPDQHGVNDSTSFLPPLEIPAGWKIKVSSDAVNLDTNGFIHGYEA